MLTTVVLDLVEPALAKEFKYLLRTLGCIWLVFCSAQGIQRVDWGVPSLSILS